MKLYKILFLVLAFICGLGYVGSSPQSELQDNFDLAIDQLQYDLVIVSDYSFDGLGFEVGSALHEPIFHLGLSAEYKHKPKYSYAAPQYKSTIAKSRGPPFNYTKSYSKVHKT